MSNRPRIMIAATGSGSGKTTVTCALLKALRKQKIKAVSFKCGPDYIDPMFHREVLGTPSRNLDLFMLGENTCKHLLYQNSQETDLSVIEGVMGFYDGIGKGWQGSSYELSEKTKTPVVLVVSCSGMGFSVVPLIKGYLELEKNNIQGVILNHTSKMMYEYYKSMIEEHLPIKAMGYLPNLPECNLESRHLGLITAKEVEALEEKMDRLGEVACETLDIQGIMALGQQSQPLSFESPEIEPVGTSIRVGIAKDRAFSFYYQDNLELLEKLGIELVPFSPMLDPELPENLDGLLLGGGYPEVYAQELASNQTMKKSIHKAISGGLPCHAECGGFMYLQQKLTTLEGKSYEMVGYLPGEAAMTKGLQRFGYITLRANEDTMLAKAGDMIQAHEFHYSDSTANGKSFEAIKPLSTKTWECMMATTSMVAGYPHIHFYSNITFAENFAKKCLDFKNTK
ncbi:MAG: cobyrinate a,c-diamide synthase [Cellulosilyticaceae bacterium]